MRINRKSYYKPGDIKNEAETVINNLKKNQERLDYITFVADGEPTLDLNLGEIIKKLKEFGYRVAVISNASLINLKEVKEDLMAADGVSLKCDAYKNETWHKINRPHGKLEHESILKGIEKNYRIAEDIWITQEDINQLITAKAGLRTDQDLLLKYYGIDLEQASKLYLAGVFGIYINIKNAVTIGLYPDLEPEKFVRFGTGAVDMLVSKRKRKDAEKVAEMIEHTKPNEEEGQDFSFQVAERMYFN